MRLVLKLHKNLTTTEWQNVERPNKNIVGIHYIFDDYEKALEYAWGDPLIVKKVSIVE